MKPLSACKQQSVKMGQDDKSFKDSTSQSTESRDESFGECLGEVSAPSAEEEEELEEEEEEEEDEEDFEDYEFTPEEEENMCRAFTLLDIDGDGVIDPEALAPLLVSWGRLPFDKELTTIMSYAKDEGCEGAKGMGFESFRKYFWRHFRGTSDENKLREAFEIFDTNPPTGRLSVVELRHYLKRKGMKLTDDEIDFLFREEDYWMLDENYMFDYEEFISKILSKPCTKRVKLVRRISSDLTLPMLVREIIQDNRRWAAFQRFSTEDLKVKED